MKEKNKGKKCKDCDREAVCKGYCRKHYEIAKRNGIIEVKNLSCSKIYGVGVNDMPRGWAKKNQRVYAVWYEMIRRCYSEEWLKKHDTYRGCIVCDKWLYLSKFLDDLKHIQGYDRWKSCVDERICLDKDISGKKIYSLDTCQFISSSENAKEAQFRNNRNKQVVRISKDGSIKIYESTIAPQHEDKFSQSTVSDCCRGNRSEYRGYQWMFLEDYKKINT